MAIISVVHPSALLVDAFSLISAGGMISFNAAVAPGFDLDSHGPGINEHPNVNVKTPTAVTVFKTANHMPRVLFVDGIMSCPLDRIQAFIFG